MAECVVIADDLTGGTPSEQTTSIAQPPSSSSRKISAKDPDPESRTHGRTLPPATGNGGNCSMLLTIRMQIGRIRKGTQHSPMDSS